jgi:hypothetical protein
VRADLMKETSLLLWTAMIACTTEIKWWDELIMNLKSHKDIYIECLISRDWAAQLNNMNVAIRQKMIEQHRKHIKKWAEKEKQDSKSTIFNEEYVRKHFKTCICAIFLTLIELIKIYKLCLTWDELFEIKKNINETDWIIWSVSIKVHLNDIIKSSIKIKSWRRLSTVWARTDKIMMKSFSLCHSLSLWLS